MILIADSGSTKTNWTLVNSGKVVQTFYTVGFNPYFQTSTEIRLIIQETLLDELNKVIGGQSIELHYYGAGCSTPEKVQIVAQALRHCFPDGKIAVNHDLLAAARALCGNEKGIACILGTGSNSCLYDGQAVIENVPSVGYFFGDYGSGAHIGKTLIQQYFDGDLPGELQDELKDLPEFQREHILDQIYNQSMPSRFLASYSKFVSARLNHPFIREMVKSCFHRFFQMQVEKYTDHQKFKVNSVGSVGYFYSEILTEVMRERGLSCGNILQSPMEGLIKYHS